MGSGSDSESSSSSSSSEEERRKREKKEKKRKREKESKREKKHRKKEKKEKKHQKHKHEKKGKNTELLETATMAKWGAYGIIKESDMHLKQEEFYAWLAEVKGVSQEMLGRRDLAEYFSSYVEDYNTATLPSEKYYNMRKWYLEEQARIAREGASAAKKAAATFERASFDDETERRLERRRAAEKKNEHVAKLMAQNMSADSSLVADMRQQQDDARKMRHLMATGNTEEAREMIKKLDPNHVTEEQDSVYEFAWSPCISVLQLAHKQLTRHQLLEKARLIPDSTPSRFLLAVASRVGLWGWTSQESSETAKELKRAPLAPMWATHRHSTIPESLPARS